MRKFIALIAVVILTIIPARAQTNLAELEAAASNLTAQIEAIKNPPAVIQTITFSNDIAISTNAAPSSTNAPVVAAVEKQINPLLNLLGGKSSWVSTLLAWLAALAAALAPFRTPIRHAIADRFNTYAAASSTEDNAYLHNLFSSKWYITTSFLLSFAGITLPNLADLNRAIAQQQEAVLKAVVPPAALAAGGSSAAPPPV